MGAVRIKKLRVWHTGFFGDERPWMVDASQHGLRCPDGRPCEDYSRGVAEFATHAEALAWAFGDPAEIRRTLSC